MFFFFQCEWLMLMSYSCESPNGKLMLIQYSTEINLSETPKILVGSWYYPDVRLVCRLMLVRIQIKLLCTYPSDYMSNPQRNHITYLNEHATTCNKQCPPKSSINTQPQIHYYQYSRTLLNRQEMKINSFPSLVNQFVKKLNLIYTNKISTSLNINTFRFA